jgi:hypothetical protein
MYYLARNKELVGEARALFNPEKGRVVGDKSSSGVIFTTLGSFPSEVLGRDVFVGVKQYSEGNNNEWKIQQRANLELATITAVAEYAVNLRDKLPTFYALLRGEKGKPRGILMEDFSQGGRLRVSSTSNIPNEVRDLFGADVIEEDFACNMGFSVDGDTKYGDFYPFFQTFKKEEALSRHPMSQAMRQVNRNMWQYTFRLGRDL